MGLRVCTVGGIYGAKHDKTCVQPVLVTGQKTIYHYSVVYLVLVVYAENLGNLYSK